MNVGAEGLKLIKEFEGRKLTAYRCPANVLTIGYGHTSMAGPPTVTAGMRITELEAEHILKNDLVDYAQAVERAVKVPLTQNQFDALLAWTFNCGKGALQKSTLLKRLNRGEYDAVPAELMKWNKVNGKELAGLTRRRRAEAKLWRGIDTLAPVNVEEARTEPDVPQPKKSIIQSREANTAIVAGAAAATGVASEVSGNVKSISEGVGVPVIVVLLVIIVACGAIWFFRKQRLEETGE